MKEKEVENKISEYYNLGNRLKRYEKKLMKAGLHTAKEKGLEVRVVHEEGIETFNPGQNTRESVAAYNSPDSFDMDEIIDLAKSRFPSLYNRYWDAMSKYNELSCFFMNLDIEEVESGSSD